ncbi:ribosomal RNA processing 1 family protein [Aspergillus homomorphus CBS 101889]|uniref:Ribosomal RNA processing protein n=1 Tax=Aspergillus homomorphus (strain CBS 101889) TaxID=1450537 RepID=A0A395HT04_ASPHC|nr:ribosomal RNA processing protein [Aspergillus homomorphus CBS 101889]RAL10495.1 ribosomal RNA processing protein [Aspergillus homomorphus CBS 101889]
MTDLGKTPFIKELASSDKKLRDKATTSLTLFLRAKTDLSNLDLLKLWKGLFFCFYHSDRPLTQQALARTLSYNLVPTLPKATTQKFLRAFWLTIGRDFHSIDRLRLDKYLFLIRCYVGVGFEVFVRGGKQKEDLNGAGDGDVEGKKRKRAQEEQTSKKGGKKRRGKGQQLQELPKEDEEKVEDGEKNDWTALESYLAILEDGPLCPVNFDPDQPPANEAEDFIPMPHGPDGLRYHVMDIWVDELEKVLEFEEEVTAEDGTTVKKPKGQVPGDLLLRPLERLRTESPYKPVRVRAAEALDDERLVQWGWKERKVESESEDDSEDEEWGGFGEE